MKNFVLEAQLREQSGKGGARSARRAGRLPGVLYGQGKNITLSVDRRAFSRTMVEAHGENLIFDITLENQPPLKAIVCDIQQDPVSRKMIHVDFHHIDMTQSISVQVVVNLLGEPEGVRNFGGILEHPGRTVEVECLPSNIPSSIEFDVADMMIGDAVHVSDLPAEGFVFLDDPTKVIAQVAAPTVVKLDEEAEEAAAAAAEEEGAEAPAEGGEEGEADTGDAS